MTKAEYEQKPKADETDYWDSPELAACYDPDTLTPYKIMKLLEDARRVIAGISGEQHAPDIFTSE